MPLAPRTPPFNPTFKPVAPDQLLKLLGQKFLLPKEDLARLAAELGDGVWQLAWSVATVNDLAVMETLRASLLETIKSGGTLRDWRKMLDDSGWRSPLGRWHEETIFRTTLGTVMEGERYEILTKDANVEFLIFDAIDDDLVDEECLSLDGQAWPRDEFPDELWPPIHYNSFLPNTLVAGSFVSGTRMLYAGKVIELETAGGNHLAVTPNHPIATPSGFVAACDLNKGSKVLAHCVGAEEMGATGDPRATLEAPDDQQKPARIDKVFAALVEVFGMRTTDTVSGDFHGDAQGGDGHVDVAVVKGVLRNRVAGEGGGNGERLGLEPPDTSDAPGVATGDIRFGGNGALRSSASTPHPLDSSVPLGGAADTFLGRDHATAAGSMAGGKSLLDKLGMQFKGSPLDTLSVGLTSGLDTALQKLAAETWTADASLFRKLLERYPALVALDEVVDVREVDWSGHVYDLQSTTGLIVAGGLIASNCRCSVIPADGNELDGLGAAEHEGPAPLDHIAEGFESPPSVRGLAEDLAGVIEDRLREDGWAVHAPAAPGR